MSSSATKASPTPLPTIPPDIGPIIFRPAFVKLKYLPAFLAAIAFLAIILAVEPVSFLNSALLNAAATSLAVFVFPTKSKISAPKDTTPFGIFHKPVATPAKADSKNPTSCSLFSFSVCLLSSLIETPFSTTNAMMPPI